MIKGVPLEPAIARDTADAILQAGLDEEDTASPRCVSLGRVLRYFLRTTRLDAHLCHGAVSTPLTPSSIDWVPFVWLLRAGC
jgi:hypothetical protein